MREVTDFLRLLCQNNDREWFAANKTMYKRAEKVFNDFAVELIDGIAAFDASVRGLTLRDCTYRIYRDTRFSYDKSPYKTWMGVYVAPHGKKSGYAGYYFHLAPCGDPLVGGNKLIVGLYMPSPVVLRSIREEIVDNGDALVASIDNSNDFSLDMNGALKRNPKDFPVGHKYDALLRLKDICIEKPVADSMVLSDDLLRGTLDDFHSAQPFVSIINRAVKYAYEEMM